MTVFDHLFDSEFRQREDIIVLQSRTGAAEASAEAALDAVARCQRRIDRLELVCEALVELLKLKGGVTQQELLLMIQRVDLADGSEDGRIGPDRSQTAPRCPQCSRPRNPQRVSCVYCGSDAPAVQAEAIAVVERDVGCTRCGTTVRESQSYFSSHGLLCEHCFAEVEL